MSAVKKIKIGNTTYDINDVRSVVISSDVTSIVLCADETAYNNISPKVSSTLYLIPES